MTEEDINMESEEIFETYTTRYLLHAYIYKRYSSGKETNNHILKGSFDTEEEALEGANAFLNDECNDRRGNVYDISSTDDLINIGYDLNLITKYGRNVIKVYKGIFINVNLERLYVIYAIEKVNFVKDKLGHIFKLVPVKARELEAKK